MTAILKVDTIQDTSGNNIINENANTITIGKSGDTVNLASGATAGFGKVLQVVSATDSTLRTTTSTSFVTGSNTLSVSITPSSASNKIFVIVSANIVNGSGDGIVFATIFRGATNLGEATNGMAMGNSVSGITPIDHPASITILDSPSSTSALTYQLYFRSNNVSYTASLNGRSSIVTKSSITAFEIAG